MVELLLAFLVFLSLLLSGLLSTTETAITAMSTAKIHKLKTDGNKNAVILSKLREDKESLISTILLANNGFNIFSSTIATALLIDIFGNEGVIYATLIMTVLIIIFAEILPKTYALSNPERAALLFAPFLQVTVNICRPITKAISFIVSILLKIFKMQHSSLLVSPTEEIKGTIEMHHHEGAVDQSDKYMLDGVFYLGETNVSEVMTHRKNMQTINLDQNIKEITKQLMNIGHTRIPVWKEKPDNIIGILNTKDLLNMLLKANLEFDKIDISSLIAEPMFVHEKTALDEQLAEFKQRKTRVAIVIDEYGDIQGMITLSDILEEVVGRIQDEHDADKEEIILKDGCCVVKGDVTIRDLNRELNWHLPDEEASTIAGLLMHEAEKIPQENEVLQFHGFIFTILEKKLNQLINIRIEKIPDEQAD
jgi:Mg2+/Co2+ transporter CorB